MAKKLKEYIDTPGFYLDVEDRTNIIVVNDDEQATFVAGSNRLESVCDPNDWKVEPIDLKRLYVERKPQPRTMKVDP